MYCQTNGDRLSTVWKSYRIPKKFINARFSNYRPKNAEQQAALQKCIEFAKQDLKQITKGKGLFLHGPVGTGKTHLIISTLHAIVAANVEQFGYKSRDDDVVLACEAELSRDYPGRCASFINVTELLNTLLEGYDGDKLAKLKGIEMLHRAKMDDIVIFDELGQMKCTGWVETQLYNLINIRYNMERPMLFTSNCTMAELKKQISERVESRLVEVTDGIYVPGADYRKRKLA